MSINETNKLDIQRLNLQSVDENGKVKTSFEIEEGTGFIIIKSAILASVGVLQYLGSSLGLTNERALHHINVFQSAQNLFSAENLAGANGVVVTDEHPEEKLVEVYNENNFILFGFSLERAKQLGKYLVNDIKITDKRAIDMILEAEEKGFKLGFSLGYMVEYKPERGTYKDDDSGEEWEYEYIKDMKKINHIAFTKLPRNKETVFTDSKEKGMEKEKVKFIFNLGQNRIETITTDSLMEVAPLVVEQSKEVARLSGELKKIKETATDSEDKITELNAKIKELKELLKAEKEKVSAAESKAENDSLKKDAIEFAKKQQIKISTDSEDSLESILKTVLTDSGVKEVEELDINALKTTYNIYKDLNSRDTTGMYKTGGKQNDSQEDSSQGLSNEQFATIFGGMNFK